MGTPLLLGSGNFVIGSISPSPLITSWYNSLTVKPSNGLLIALNTLVDGINSDGDWANLDLFHTLGGMETDEQRLRPLKSTSGLDFTAVNSPTLNINGVTGNGTNSYLNLNWIPSVNGVNYTQNSACFGCYNRTTGNINTRIEMGTSDGTNQSTLLIAQSISGMNYRINSGTLNTHANANPLALASVLRTVSGANGTDSYMRGVSLGVTTSSSTGLPSQTFYLCALNSNGIAANFSSRNLSLVFAGGGTINQLNFYNRIQTYMTTVGINV